MLINRQDAIDALDRFNCCGYVEEEFIRLAEAIRALPSAERKGRWESANDWFTTCSICGAKWYKEFPTLEVWNYCPNCGTKMLGVEENG